MPTVVVDNGSGLVTSIVIPLRAWPGTHALTVVATKGIAVSGAAATSASAVLAAAAVVIVAPAPTPIPANTVNVPSSIDATGSSDASSALNSFIGSVPDGSTIVFRAGGTYRLDTGIYVSGRNRLVFEGNGATLRANGSGASLLASPFAIDQGNSYITIRDFTITGNNPNTTTIYNAGQENQFGVGVWGSTNVEIANNTISHTWGDGVYVSGNDTTHVSSDSVWVHDNTFSYIGRSGIALTAGSHVTVEHNSFDRVGIHVFNIEPDTAYQIDTFDTFEDNTVGIYSLSTNYVGYFFAADGAAGSTVHDVTVTGNTVVGNPHGGYGGYAHGLDTSVQVARRANITFTNNSTSTAAAGPVLAFDHVDGVTVTGNTQPLSSRSLTEFTDCTGVVYP